MAGRAGQFRPLVWTLADGRVFFEPPRVIDVANRSVLVSRDRIEGTGNFYYEDDFVFDQQSETGVNLHVDAAVGEELKQVLPPGTEVRKGGGFHIETLRFQQGVWKRSDPNCCPSAGSVAIQFAIRDNALAVTKAEYHP